MNSARSTHPLFCKTAVLIPALLGILLSFDASGLSLAPPQLGTPCVISNHVIFTSADSKQLICITADSGRELWKRDTTGDRWSVLRSVDGKVWVNCGTDLWQCNPATGDMTPAGRLAVRHLRLEGGESNTVWITAQGTNDQHFLSEVDPQRGRERWRMNDGIQLLATTTEWALVGTEQRQKAEFSYPFGYNVTGVSIEAISRKTGVRVWSYRFDRNQEDSPPFSYHSAIVAGNHVVVLSQTGQIDCLRLTDGKSLVTEETNKAASSGSLEMIDGKVIGCFSTFPNNGARRRFYELSLPDLFRKEFPSPPPEASLHQINDGVGICSDGELWLGYDVRTGKTLWQKRRADIRWEWRGAHANHLFISSREYPSSASAILRINLRTGELKELYRQKMNW